MEFVERSHTRTLLYFSGESAVEVDVEVEPEVGGDVETAGEPVPEVLGTGAPFPAVLDPKPSLLRDTASIFPVGLIPFLS